MNIAPRDFTVSRPSYYTAEHEVFLDELELFGPSGPVSMIGELMAEFDIGPAAAERIVRYWRASR